MESFSNLADLGTLHEHKVLGNFLGRTGQHTQHQTVIGDAIIRRTHLDATRLQTELGRHQSLNLAPGLAGCAERSNRAPHRSRKRRRKAFFQAITLAIQLIDPASYLEAEGHRQGMLTMRPPHHDRGLVHAGNP